MSVDGMVRPFQAFVYLECESFPVESHLLFYSLHMCFNPKHM